MLNKFFLIAGLLFFGFSGLPAQVLDQFQLEQVLKQHVYFLAADSLEGRGLGTEGKVLAKKYIADKFASFGLLPYNEAGYFHHFFLRIGMARVKATNVVGYLPGTDPVLADEYILIGAHYDHLGVSEKRGQPVVFNGADDNASGVAVMIELARHFAANRDFLKRSMIFMAFDAEESGLLGAKEFVRGNELVDVSQIKTMFSLDMVGMYTANDGVDLKGIGRLAGGEKLAKDIAGSFKITLKKLGSDVEARTDTKPFGDTGIPAIHAFTGLKSPYHKPEDTYEKLDYEGMTLIARYLSSLISEMVNLPELKSGSFLAKKDSKIKLDGGILGVAGNSRHRYPDEFYTAKPVFGFGAGLFGQLKFKNGICFQPEILYFSDGSKSAAGTFRRHSVMIPLAIQYNLTGQIDDMFGMFLFGGGYYLKSFEGSNGGVSLDFDDLYSDSEWGYQLGFGFDIMSWQIKTGWQNGITNLIKNDGIRVRSNGAYLAVGYRF